MKQPIHEVLGQCLHKPRFPSGIRRLLRPETATVQLADLHTHRFGLCCCILFFFSSSFIAAEFASEHGSTLTAFQIGCTVLQQLLGVRNGHGIIFFP